MVKKYQLYVDGRWQQAAESMALRSPIDGTGLAEIGLASAEQAAAAAHIAAQAFDHVRRQPAYERARLVRRIAEALDRRREEFAQSICLEAAKPITAARVEVHRAIQTFTLSAEEVNHWFGEMLPLDLLPDAPSTSGTPMRMALARRVPVGPVLAIPAFNFPLNLVAHKVAPALAAGCPVVLKPAPQTPLTSLRLAEVIHEAGAPAGSFAVLPCHNDVAEGLVRDDRFALLSFTGSAKVGWHLKRLCGNKRVLLEMGGNGAVVVAEDADLEHAVRRCVFGGFVYAGQICVGLQRIYITDPVYEPFVEKFADAVKHVKPTDPRSEQSLLGPMITEAAAERAEALVQEAVGAGAEILAGGRREGAWMEPTVLANVTPEMRVVCEEAFAPVVTVSRVPDWEAGLAEADDPVYGLQAGIFTRDVNRVLHAFDQLQSGGIVVNDVPIFRAEHVPFGGMKQSGQGRESVRHTMEAMTEWKTLMFP